MSFSLPNLDALNIRASFFLFSFLVSSNVSNSKVFPLSLRPSFRFHSRRSRKRDSFCFPIFPPLPPPSLAAKFRREVLQICLLLPPRRRRETFFAAYRRRKSRELERLCHFRILRQIPPPCNFLTFRIYLFFSSPVTGTGKYVNTSVPQFVDRVCKYMDRLGNKSRARVLPLEKDSAFSICLPEIEIPKLSDRPNAPASSDRQTVLRGRRGETEKRPTT